MPGFRIHPKLVEDCHVLGRLGTSHLLLHRNASVPWFILVPEVEALDLCDLDPDARRAVCDEADELGRFVKGFFGVPRINVAAIGNVVPQLHVHVVGRAPGDPCWPRPVWGHLATVAEWGPARIGELAAGLAARRRFVQDVL